MFNATTDTPPPNPAGPTAAAGNPGPYATPPQLDRVISPQQRDAVNGSVEGAVGSSTRRGILSGTIFGALLGVIAGAVSGRFWLKTGIFTAAGALTGLLLSNLTWVAKPDTEAPLPLPHDIPREPPPMPITAASHVAQVEAERATAGQPSPERA